jgi:hypothetical protein
MSLKTSERPEIDPTTFLANLAQVAEFLASTKPRLKTPVPVPGSALPTIHLLVTVTNFRSLLLPARNKTVLTEHRIELLTEHQNVSLEDERNSRQPSVPRATASMTNSNVSVATEKVDGNARTQQTLRVKNEGAILRFKIVDEKDSGVYYRPIAITFALIGAKKKAAVHWNSGNQTGAYTPFSSLQLNGPILQITDTLPPVISGKKKKRVRYKFSILFQNRSTGDLGLIDPVLDNDNDWVDPDNEVEPPVEGEEPPEGDEEEEE